MRTRQPSMTQAQAVQLIRDIVKRSLFSGLSDYTRQELENPPFEDHMPSLEWRRSFSTSCGLYVRFDRDLDYAGRDAVKDGKAKTYAERWIPTVEVTWSSTGRSVSQATAAIALYQQVTRLAAEIEARLGDESIGRLVDKDGNTVTVER